MRRSVALAMLLSSGTLSARSALPRPVDLPPAMPVARDVAYPGTLTLDVDATDAPQGILRVQETIPVAGGPAILYFPQWKPGNHSPTGPLQNLAGLMFEAGGKPVAWMRASSTTPAVPEPLSSAHAGFRHHRRHRGRGGR